MLAEEVAQARSVDQLWAAARGGDEAAWAEIVRRFDGVVRRAAPAYALSPADADDVAQSTWLRLLANGAQVREPAALPGWLATTARRECMRLRTAQLRELPVEPDELPEHPAPAAAAADLHGAERRAALRDALAALTPRQRALVSMLADDGEPSYAEIAGALDMPVGSIGPTRARCLRQLRMHGALTRLAAAD